MRKIHYAGRVYNNEEISNLKQATEEFQLTSGHFIKEFEEGLSDFLNVKYSLMVSSGSSANLLAFMTLTSHELGEKRITRNSEVITTACCFPTTISPIINYGAIPVFVDVNIDTMNINTNELELALTERTRAVFIAHTLGNPFNITTVLDFCKKYNLWLISDCCDSLGSTYKGNSLESYGDISTSSFYPAHHITCGNGGAIHTNNNQLYKIAKSFCNWGRDYKCNECISDCKKRYENNYDCRYEYNHLGFNLQPTEFQAAIGVAQLKKLNKFIEVRQNNWNKLRVELDNLYEYFYFQEFKMFGIVSPFAFLLTLKSNCNFKRNEIVQYLEDNGIETRFLFAGNILRQKCFSYLQESIDYKVIGNLDNTNYIMDNSFFIGCYPGLEKEDLDYMIQEIKNFIELKENTK